MDGDREFGNCDRDLLKLKKLRSNGNSFPSCSRIVNYDSSFPFFRDGIQMPKTLPFRCLVVFSLILSTIAPLETQADSAIKLPPNLIVRLELEKDSVKLGQPLVGKVVFENTSPVDIRLFYPGFKTSDSRSIFGARIEGVLANGKPRIVCSTRTDKAETRCEVVEVKTSPTVGEVKNEDRIFVSEIIEELVDAEPTIATIRPGKTVHFDFRFDDCREAIPNYFEIDENGQRVNKDPKALPVVFTGTYELRFTYECTDGASEKSWLGKTNPPPV
ncbi:MAG: hypothetical protein ACI9HK_004587, partial [Pirellulaceae bacterium]